MKATQQQKCTSGFTLVELLVVIAIIAAIAAISVMGFSKYKKSAVKTVSTSNLRNIGVTMAAWSTDHGSAFPSIRGYDESAGEASNFQYWHWKLYDQAYNNGGQFVENSKWKSTVFYNPLMKPELVANWTCGYAMNARLIENLYGIGWQKAISQPLKLAVIEDPARSPIVAPRRDHQYRSAADLLYNEDGKTPILFCDGHVVSLSRAEYEKNKYDSLFKKP